MKIPAPLFPKTGTKVYRVLAGSLVAGLLLGVLLYKSEARSVYRSATSIPLESVLLMTLLIYVSVPFRVLQWILLLPPETEVRYLHLTQAQCLGYLGNSLLPFGGGEFIKAGYIAEVSSTGLTRAIASILMVRLQDVLPVLALAFFGTARMTETLGAQHEIVFQVGMISAAIGSGLAFTGIILLYRYGVRLALASSRVVAHVSTPLSIQCERTIGSIAEGFQAVGHPSRLVASQVCSIICWCLFSAAPMPLLVSLGLDIPAAAMCAVVLTGLANLVQLVPITPAGLGTYDVLCVLVVSSIVPGFSYETVVAFAFVTHAIGALVPALLGILMLPWAAAHLSSVLQKRKDLAASTQDAALESNAAPISTQEEVVHNA